MSECPQGTCDGLEHIKENMVDKRSMHWTVGAILVPLFLSFSAAWAVTNTRVNKALTTNAVILEKLNSIKESVEKIERNQITIPRIHEEITKRLKDYNDYNDER